MTNAKAIAESYITSLEARDWDAISNLLTTDVVYEMPQSRERITGRDSYLRFNQEYPGDWHLAINRVVADDNHAVIWVNARVGDELQLANIWLDINADGQIARVTDFWPETFAPPESRNHLTEVY